VIRYIRSESMPGARPALFLDRDGVLNRREVGGYVTTPAQFELLDVALESAIAAQSAGAAIIIVTNQGCIGRRKATESDVMQVHAVLLGALSSRGICVDAIYSCPHHPASPDPSLRECECRKPHPGLILAAASDLNIDLSRSIMIGDQPSDAAAALAAGIATDRTFLVDVIGETTLALRVVTALNGCS